MIGAILNTLGLGDDSLPDEHAARHNLVAARVAKIEAARAAEAARLNDALAASAREAAAQAAKEREALEAADRAAGDRIAAAAVPALSAAWTSYRSELGRAELRELAAVLRDLDSKCRTATGAELPVTLIIASFAKAMLEAKPQCEGALLSTEYTGDALSPAGRLLRAAVAVDAVDVVDLEKQASAIEQFFAKSIRYKSASSGATEEQRETFDALLASGRAVDRANRLREIAERYGAEKQRAFEAGYAPASGPIVSHVPQPHDLF